MTDGHLQKIMSLGDHLEELRSRILKAAIGFGVALILSFVFGKVVVDFLMMPYLQAADTYSSDASLAVLAPAGGVMVYCRLCFYFALILSSPWVIYQLWQFVAAGLYKREQRLVLRAVPFSAGLFVCGAAFFYFVVSDYILRFFHSFNNWLGLKEVITLPAYVGFITTMMLVFALAFQLPLVVWVLARTGLVPLEKFRHYRKHVIVGLLIVAAVCTSPSPVDQLLLALPMWGLYEIGIIMAAIAIKKRQNAVDN